MTKSQGPESLRERVGKSQGWGLVILGSGWNESSYDASIT